MEEGESHKHCRCSKINLVDLAGSERLSHSCTTGDRLRVRTFLKLTQFFQFYFRWNGQCIVVCRKTMKGSAFHFLVLHFIFASRASLFTKHYNEIDEKDVNIRSPGNYG
jgi:hypothetical protein